MPCNLSLITTLVCDCPSFSDINVPQGSVATHMKGGGSLISTLLQIYWRIKQEAQLSQRDRAMRRVN